MYIALYVNAHMRIPTILYHKIPRNVR